MRVKDSMFGVSPMIENPFLPYSGVLADHLAQVSFSCAFLLLSIQQLFITYY